MRWNHPLINGSAGLAATAVVRSWMGTLDRQVAYYDRSVDPVYPECTTPKLYLFWHEYILFPLHLRGHCHLTMLLSRHRDADILSAVARLMGFEFVRGSTNRGGITALRSLMRQEGMHLTITPDGPRGPRRRLALGPIYLASRLGMPLVLLGCGFDRPIRLGSWDRFAVPRLFSRARAVVSPAITVPADLDRSGLEKYRQYVENLLNRLTTESETWAESGTRRRGQQPMEPRPAACRPRLEHSHATATPEAATVAFPFDRPERAHRARGA